MGFSFQPIEGQRFTSIDALDSFVGAEEQSVHRVPIADLLDRGSEFFDDHSFGIPGEGLQFNEEGLRSLCSTLSLPFTIVGDVEQRGLATDLLNDLARRQDVQSTLRGHEFVVNENSCLILGVVSNSYRTYSNRQLLNDMQGFLSTNGQSNGKLRFQAASVVNTRLRFRVLKPVEHGHVTGQGGENADRSCSVCK